LFAAERPYRKKLMAARCAAQRREAEEASENSGHARDVLAGDALQTRVAANSAMRVKKRAKRQRARVEPRGAVFAAPRQDSHDAEEMIQHRPALGTPAIPAVAYRAAYGTGVDHSSPSKA